MAGNVVLNVMLITKTRTQNQGNQALSTAWFTFLSKLFGEGNVQLEERVPPFLKRYGPNYLARFDDPIVAFDAVASKLVAEARRAPGPVSAGEPGVSHDASIAQARRFIGLRQRLNLRGKLGWLSIGKDAYLARLRAMDRADLVVVNPAGEFLPQARDAAIAYLLDLRCAQLMGCRTAIVNLSYEADDPMVRSVSHWVFRHTDIVEFRDSQSSKHLGMAVDELRPVVLPDAAILTPRPERQVSTGKGVLLAINALQVDQAGLEPQWTAFVDKLKTSGIQPTLTSNEWTTDYPFWSRYINEFGLDAVGRECDFRQYAALLGSYDLVVSSRLHTCVLSLVAGTPVIPIETGTFKLSGFFEQIGLSDEVISFADPEWSAKVIERIRTTLDNPEPVRAAQEARYLEARERLESGLRETFAPLLT